jgi:hypothetical protein
MMPGCGAPMPPWACGELMPSGVRALCDACGGKPDPCSCDEALALRAQLAAATAGTVALHVVKSDGFWTVERWRDGALVESYVGVATVADAMDRIGDWMRIPELQANLAGKGDER